MQKNQFSRNELAFGHDITKQLEQKRVAIIGAGGVGGMAIECLVRMGIGNIYICDFDTIDITNLNRQIFTTLDTVGHVKAEAIEQRILSINPRCNVKVQTSMFTSGTSGELLAWKPDFIIDCADTISYKVECIEFAKQNDIPFIISLGMANKFEPEKVTITDLSKTTYDPIAKILRKKVKENKIKGKIPVVFSPEIPLKPIGAEMLGDVTSDIRKKKIPPASNVFVPNTAGLLAAHHVIQYFMSNK